MPEMRRDPVTGNWVIIAFERSKRPFSYARPKEEAWEGECPFCYGHEKETPPEIMAYRKHPGANSAGWSVRVVPNKYAALETEAGDTCSSELFYQCLPGFGAHEVVIEAPEHDSTLGTHSRKQTEQIITALKERYLDLKKDRRYKYIQVFKNQGRFAGASLAHPHFQLVAAPIIPPDVQARYNGAEKYFHSTGRCVYCDMANKELAVGRRIIEISEEFIALNPYASRFPYETWVVPKRHQPDFGQITDSQVSQLAGMLGGVIRRLENRLQKPAYNVVLRTAPNTEENFDYYHWHLEILPRLTGIAGFELSTGIYINLIPPETACAALKQADSANK